jgi:hypothetical protein
MRRRFFALAGLVVACASLWACSLIADLGDPPSLVATEAGPVTDAGLVATEAGPVTDAGIAYDGPAVDASPDFLGVGFARLSEETRATCIDFEPVVTDDGGADASDDTAAPDASDSGPGPTPSGESVDVGFTVGATGGDLLGALGLRPAALASGLTAANDPRAAYLVDHPITPRTVRAVLSARVAGPATQIFPTALTAAAAALIADAGAFNAACGDAFVDTERPQIGFFAALEIETLNAREYTDILDELTAIQADAAVILDPWQRFDMLNVAIGAALGSKVVHVWTYRLGSAAPKESCLDDLTCVFQLLNQTLRATPDARLDLAPSSVTPYDRVLLLAPGSGPAAVTAALPEQGNLAASLCTVRDLVASIDDIAQYAADYPSADPTALSQARADEAAYEQTVAAALHACSLDASACNASLNPPAQPQLPARSLGTNLAAGPDPTKDDSGFEQQTQRDPVALPWQSFCVDLSHVGLTLTPDQRMGVGIDRWADVQPNPTARSGNNNGFVVTRQEAGPSASLCGLSQQVAVEPFHTYSAGAWLCADGLQQGELGVVATPGGTPLSTITFKPLPTRYHYRALTFDSGPNTSVTLYMQMYGTGENPTLSFVQIDDVTLFAE